MDQLFTFIDFHLSLDKHANTETLACWLAISAEAQNSHLYKEAFETITTKYRDILCDLIKSGQTAGLFKVSEPAEVATAVFAAIQGYFVLSVTSPSLIPKGSAARCVKQMFCGLIDREDGSTC